MLWLPIEKQAQTDGRALNVTKLMRVELTSVDGDVQTSERRLRRSETYGARASR
jgi:hypothetical protein